MELLFINHVNNFEFKTYIHIFVQILFKMSNGKGIKDLMDEKRYAIKHIQKALVESDVPGNWLSTQNVYNFINGNTIPRDPYVFIFIADFLGEELRKIIYRYSDKKTRYNVSDTDLF